MNSLEFRATAALSTLIVFEVFAIPLLLLALYDAIVRHTDWGGVTVAGSMAILIFAWWRSFLLEIGDGYLKYRSLFSHPPRILLDDIESATRKVEVRSRGVRPPNRIEIRAVSAGKKVEFDINMKAFSLSAIRHIEDVLKARHK